jgi:uncharacterized protein with von Willebrand factor type A (vWA) domain
MNDTNPNRLGGVIHTYQKYDPINIPSPTQSPPDLVSPAFQHMLEYGSMDGYTEEQLANAIRLDPSQIAGLGPTMESLRQQLLERRRKLLEKYETQTVTQTAEKSFRDLAKKLTPPARLKQRFDAAVNGEQLADLEELYFSASKDREFSQGLVRLSQRLADKYQIDEMAGKYEFTGRTRLDIPTALTVKEELDTIEKLLKQLEDAKKNAQLAIIDVEELNQFIDREGMDSLRELQQQVEDLLREMAWQQGIDGDPRKGYQLTPKAFRLFQSKILTQIFSDLQNSRTGRHPDPVIGEGATESSRTKPYEFGDSVTHMDIPGSFTNALLRAGPGLPVRMKPDDIVVHHTRNTPKAATCVLLDMSGSMRHDGHYVNVKRMGLALDGLIRKEYPGDYLQFIEMYTFAKPRHVSDVPTLMPKPVTIFNSSVRLKADMSDPKIGEYDIPHHFTNIQHGLQTARRHLAHQDTPNRQVILITDGLPTAHFEGSELYLLYPPHPRTEDATLREAKLCAKEGITINIFLLQSWNQSREDIWFAYRMAEQSKGRVVFTAGRDLDRFVVWDYIKRRKTIVS